MAFRPISTARSLRHECTEPEKERSMSLVSEIPTADPNLVAEHYARRLAFETDCSDVRQAMTSGNMDFVLIDVRGPALFQEQHIPGAINLPHGKMTARKMAEWPEDTLFVVYCAGP